ncbi:hypothetical protein [Bradyrhizobium sp. Ash2021]|uniref:hypothetical protein n=1 Tax=Bradyrhizobium sp. Ash2021 TaxID=2954771 RepID=UPI0028162EF4|nr:hypothetical protein [Bradyrhizobium sp. Ash2021]WMT71072.1 hypothetical protein NL528_23495 [Bradyrhizobium sp. Ash2021]
MIGLKSYLPKLETLTGLTREVLYERQRALVKCGALEAQPGRGPGSGVRADARSVSVFLISLLSHDTLVDASKAIDFGRLKSDVGRCDLTDKFYFKDVLEAILSNERIAEKVWAVIVQREQQSASIQFRGRHLKYATSGFATRAIVRVPKLMIEPSITATLSKNFILQVAKDIAEFSEETK